MFGQSAAMRCSPFNRNSRQQNNSFGSGETGTGKELVARNACKIFKKGELISINCSAIPADLLESELFGTKKAPLPAPKPVMADLRWHLVVPYS